MRWVVGALAVVWLADQASRGTPPELVAVIAATGMLAQAITGWGLD